MALQEPDSEEAVTELAVADYPVGKFYRISGEHGTQDEITGEEFKELVVSIRLGDEDTRFLDRVAQQYPHTRPGL
jgi:hypothetical protein